MIVVVSPVQRSADLCGLHGSPLRGFLVISSRVRAFGIGDQLDGLCLSHTPHFLLFEKHLLHCAHFEVDPDAHGDGDDENGAEHDGFDHVVVALLEKQNTQVDEEDLLGEREERGDDEMPELDVARGEDGRGEMRGNGRETHDEDDEEAAVAGEAGHGPEIEIGAFQLEGLLSEGIFEGIPCADYKGSYVSMRQTAEVGGRAYLRR